MFESEEAAKSRLQFISQLAGGAAGMSLLAACGGSGLGNSSASSGGGSGLTPGSGLVPAFSTPETSNVVTLLKPALVETPEIQKLMFQTDCRAITHPDGVGVLIRDDFKNNARFVDELNGHQALVKLQNAKRGKVKPNYLCIGDDCNGGDSGGGSYQPYQGFGYYGELPIYQPIGSPVFTDPFGGENQDNLGVGSIFTGTTPWIYGYSYWTSTTQRNCTGITNKIDALANEINALCSAHEVLCGQILTGLAALFRRGAISAARLVLAALALLASAEELVILAGVGLAVSILLLIEYCTD